MIVKFWGVRGSIPTPIASNQIQSKISAVVQRITLDDIKSQNSRERFIASLPQYLFGTTGGNTACVELKCPSGTEIILDAGSALRAMSYDVNKARCYNIFFSHFHWDHIQGLPFFSPIFDENVTFDIYSTHEDARDILALQMRSPYFPVDFSKVEDRMTFHTITPGEVCKVGEAEVRCCMMAHPGGSSAYSFSIEGKKFVYATDVELKGAEGAADTVERRSVFEGASCAVLDSQYTVAEAYKKGGWGHSAFCYAVDFAAKWNIKNLYLFHHEPSYDDRKLNDILETARWYARYIERRDVNVFLAREGIEISSDDWQQ